MNEFLLFVTSYLLDHPTEMVALIVALLSLGYRFANRYAPNVVLLLTGIFPSLPMIASALGGIAKTLLTGAKSALSKKLPPPTGMLLLLLVPVGAGGSISCGATPLQAAKAAAVMVHNIGEGAADTLHDHCEAHYEEIAKLSDVVDREVAVRELDQYCLPLAASYATLKASDETLRGAIAIFEEKGGTVAQLALAIEVALDVAEAARSITEAVNAR